MPHRLTTLPVLPEPLAALGPLAHGLAAEWDDALAGLFRALAPDSGATAPLELLAAAAIPACAVIRKIAARVLNGLFME